MLVKVRVKLNFLIYLIFSVCLSKRKEFPWFYKLKYHETVIRHYAFPHRSTYSPRYHSTKINCCKIRGASVLINFYKSRSVLINFN